MSGIVYNYPLTPNTTTVLNLPVDAVAQSVDVLDGRIVLAVEHSGTPAVERAERTFIVSLFNAPVTGVVKALGRVFLAGSVYNVYEVAA